MRSYVTVFAAVKAAGFYHKTSLTKHFIARSFNDEVRPLNRFCINTGVEFRHGLAGVAANIKTI